MKTWTYIFAAAVCVALSVTFLTNPATSTAQEGGQTVTPVRIAPSDLDTQPASDQQGTPSETNRALFFFQNQAFASYYQQIAAADSSMEIVVVSDVDSFLEQAVIRPGWDVTVAFPDPAERSDSALVDHLSTILDSMASNQGGVQMLVAEQPLVATDTVLDQAVGVRPAPSAVEEQVPMIKRTPPLRFEAWMDDSHLSAIYFADGRHKVREAVGDSRPLMGIGMVFNENRIDFSAPPNVSSQRAPGAPFCCGVVWAACVGTTCSDLCGVLFIPCFFNLVQNPCHSMDGVCGICPGAPHRCFFLCNDPLCLPPNPLGCDC